jgi:predicted RNA-binding Zn-ribbon protein involved in translation (DUF1610 family)
MPISFSCPQCGKKLKAPDNAVGKSSKCPGCGGTVTCPEPIYDAELVEAPPAVPGGVGPYSDLDPDQPYAVVDPGPAVPATESRRPCPMCGEMIVATAAKCRYCGEVFDPTIKRAQAKKSKKHAPDGESLTTGDMVVAVLCSGIGCIAGLVWMIQGKPKGMKMFGLSFLMVVIWNLILTMVSVRQKLGGMGGP